MDNLPESKLRENLRYLGYAAGALVGAIITGLVWLFLGPIAEFLWSVLGILMLLAIVGGLLTAAVYLIFFRDSK